MKNKKNKSNKKSSTIEEIITPITTSDTSIISDYDGSYTGVPVDDNFSKPIQDADDL